MQNIAVNVLPSIGSNTYSFTISRLLVVVSTASCHRALSDVAMI